MTDVAVPPAAVSSVATSSTAAFPTPLPAVTFSRAAYSTSHMLVLLDDAHRPNAASRTLRPVLDAAWGGFFAPPDTTEQRAPVNSEADDGARGTVARCDSAHSSAASRGRKRCHEAPASSTVALPTALSSRAVNARRTRGRAATASVRPSPPPLSELAAVAAPPTPRPAAGAPSSPPTSSTPASYDRHAAVAAAVHRAKAFIRKRGKAGTRQPSRSVRRRDSLNDDEDETEDADAVRLSPKRLTSPPLPELIPPPAALLHSLKQEPLSRSTQDDGGEGEAGKQQERAESEDEEQATGMPPAPPEAATAAEMPRPARRRAKIRFYSKLECD